MAALRDAARASRPVYTRAAIEAIRERRAQSHEHTLFFDTILQQVTGQTGAIKQYPPSSNEQLLRLVDAIDGASADELKRQLCLYYLSKDCARGPEFSKAVAMPPALVRVIDGYWALDRHHFDEAYRCLASSTVAPWFPVRVMRAFAEHCPRNGYNLAVGYYTATRPDLASERDVDFLFSCLTRVDPVEALVFMRQFDDVRQRERFQKLLLRHLCDLPDHQLVCALGWNAEERQTLRMLAQEQGARSTIRDAYKAYLLHASNKPI